ncbi:MAG TPA: HAD-IA family hydrolase [Patescibacteria group bacterium]|nr:HAD-IA family hydrolase [Patescibacteria group bacterium]
MKRVKFIYFDVGEVLISGATSKDFAEKLLGINYEDFKKVYKKHRFNIYKGTVSTTDLLTLYKKEFPSIKTTNPFEEWLTLLSPIQEMHTLISKLHPTYQLGIITNSYSGTFDKIQQKNLLPNVLFTHIVDSSKVGFAKPEKEIYMLAQGKTGLLAEEILFIDNKEENILAAQKMGWQGFIFNQNNPTESVKALEKLLL